VLPSGARQTMDFPPVGPFGVNARRVTFVARC